MATILYAASDIHGDESFSGTLALDPFPLSGIFQGNGLMTGSGNIILEPLDGAGSFQGNATFIGAGDGTFDPTPFPLSGSFQGNGLFVGSGNIFNPDPLSLSGDFQGNGLFTGTGDLDGNPPEPAIAANMSATLEGDDNFFMDGVVIDPEVEPPETNGPCDVTYDTEICHVDFING